ncbi:large exoprotein involved in heme utilization and adhesion [Janthinobacterium sp. S3M3]|nr:large exoprotein involved in heme utilization and adhesion [Janthinobacterium sp. S3T4]MBB5615264.1 large exoprotein involved in heme utilization and adhesion [Janthinobacterium sp. S3M3]
MQQGNVPAVIVGDTTRIRVQSLRVTSPPLFAESELIAATGFVPGSELSLTDLRAMATKIADYYHTRGYFLAQAYLPAQDIKDGVVNIAVLPGQYGKVTVRNASRLSDGLANTILTGLDGQIIATEPLERRLLLLSDMPGVQASSTLAPGESLGTSDLIVDLQPGARVNGSVDADNQGNRYTGRNRIGATVNVTELAGIGDVATVRAFTSADGLNYVRGAYQGQIGAARLGAAYTYMDYRLGNLSANGKVFIVNPNGILFGQGASINTAGLVASTLDISNSDFMSGKYQFSGNGTGKVLNQGSISAPGGYVALLGANVSNQGTIQARLGSVALAAGRAITLDVAGDGLLNVAINEGAVGALVNNGGLIKADGGNVLLSAQAAGDLLKTVVNNTGIIEAHSIDTRGGTIKLLGDMQSGTVNAAGTLDASAPTGGNGGFIDTSAAHVKLDDGLKVTTAAAKGLAGTWLIDPTDYNIAASGGDQTGAFFSNALKSSNVQIQSVSGGSGTQGNINVNDTISWSANKLTLTAQNNININKTISGSGTASLALEYGQQAVAAGNSSTYNIASSVTVDLPTGNNFSTKLGSDGGVTAYKVINSLGAVNSTTGNDLQGINGALGGNYVLGSNIDARATSGWNSGAGFSPIGHGNTPLGTNNATPFTGQFDGLGHVISGLTINRPNASVGLFGVIGSGATVSNLGLVGAA